MKRSNSGHVGPALRARGVKMLKGGATLTEVARTVGVSHPTVGYWAKRAGLKPSKRTAKRATKPPPKLSVMDYLHDRLGTIALLLREKLPELTEFALTTPDDGKTYEVSYVVRQTVSGTVKL